MKLSTLLPGLIGFPLLSRSASASPTPVTSLSPPQPQGIMPAHTVTDSINVDGFAVRSYTWSDSIGLIRDSSLVNSSRQDPLGFYGGYMRNYNYVANGTRLACSSSDPDHPGTGFLVNHYIQTGPNGTVTYPSDSSRFHVSTAESTYLNGSHHSIHEYRYNYTLGGQPMSALIHWLFKSGQDHPLWAVTYDTSAAAPNSIMADTRSPYGSFDYDGGKNSVVAGIGWGDRYKFVTNNQTTFTMASGWRYNEPNTVPYVLSYTQNYEMGFVQTQTYLQHDAGGSIGYRFWNTTAPAGPMLADYAWTYQLNQYELPYTNTSKRIAMGSNYGAVGQASYPSYGNDRNLSGSPFQSYAVHVVLGLHHNQAVAKQVAAVEAVQHAKLMAGAGVRIRTAMPAGVGRTDTQAHGGPVGYNPAYATWEVVAAYNTSQMSLSLQANNGTLRNPTFVVHNWLTQTPPVAVLANTVPLTANSMQGYWASVDAARQTLWLTIGTEVTARKPLTLTICAAQPKAAVAHRSQHWSKLAVGLSIGGVALGLGGLGGIYAVKRRMQTRSGVAQDAPAMVRST